MNAQQQSILQVIVDKGRMSVADLVRTADVSGVTIRQDLNPLEKQNYLRCTHGYTVSLDSEDIETCMTTYFAIKRELTSRAAALAGAGETVLVENDSSNALLVCTLAERGDTTITTVSSYVTHLLKETPGEMILLGGIYQKCSESMVGPLTRQSTQQVHFSEAFIRVDGWQVETGFTGRDMVYADVVNAALEKHCEATVPNDSSEFSVVHPYPLGLAEHFNRVITDDRLSAACRDQLLCDGPTVDIVSCV